MRAKYRVKKLPFPCDYRVRDRVRTVIFGHTKKAPEALCIKVFGGENFRVNFRVIIVSEIQHLRVRHRVKFSHTWKKSVFAEDGLVNKFHLGSTLKTI